MERFALPIAGSVDTFATLPPASRHGARLGHWRSLPSLELDRAKAASHLLLYAGLPRLELARRPEIRPEVWLSGCRDPSPRAKVDLLVRPEFQPDQLARRRAELDAANFQVAGLGSSVRFDYLDAEVRQQQLEIGCRYIDLAHINCGLGLSESSGMSSPPGTMPLVASGYWVRSLRG